MTRRLGERQHYKRDSLAAACHYDAHVLALALDDDSWPFEGFAASWYVRTGKRRQKSGPAAWFMDRQARRETLERCQERLDDGLLALSHHDPLLCRAVLLACLSSAGDIIPDYRVKHRHEGWDRLLASPPYRGDDRTLWRHLTRAWELLAARIVEEEVLAAAIEQGAIADDAVEWAQSRR